MTGCEPFLEADITSFLALAEGEGWLCGRWEFEFLLDSFPQGCFVRREGGITLGSITSVSYARSGWIGNLLVHPDARRRGIGRELMQRAVSTLQKSGVSTIWLTASEKGAGLYRELGFVSIDTIQRWSGNGVLNQALKPAVLDIDSIGALDRAGWGDRRETLLQVTCGHGRLYTGPDGFLCCQQWRAGMQIGPWGCLSATRAGQLFAQLLKDGDGHVFLDVPAGNLPAAALLVERGFVVKGSSTLMYLGDPPLYTAENIYALASMGSMG